MTNNTVQPKQAQKRTISTCLSLILLITTAVFLYHQTIPSPATAIAPITNPTTTPPSLILDPVAHLPAHTIGQDDNYLYATNGIGYSLYDYTPPFSPTYITHYTPTQAAWSPTEIEHIGNLAFVNTGYDGLRILDVTTPTHPVELSHHQPLTTTYDNFYYKEIEATPNYVYVLEAYDFFSLDHDPQFTVLDVTDPINPQQIGTISLTETNGGYTEYMTNLIVRGNWAYHLTTLFTCGDIGCSSRGHFIRIIDISDPTNPFVSHTHDITGLSTDTTIANNIAYIAQREISNFTGGLNMVDLTNPNAPVTLGLFDTGEDSSTTAVTAHQNIAFTYNVQESPFITQTNPTLKAFDIHNHTTITQVGTVPSPHPVTQLHVNQNLLLATHPIHGTTLIQTLNDKTSTTISNQGGTLTATHQNLQITFPPLFFTQTTTVTYRHTVFDVAPFPLAGTNTHFMLSANDSTTGQPIYPNQPYTITLNYDETNLGTAIEETLALYQWQNNTWLPITTTLNTKNNQIVATTNCWCPLALFGNSHNLFLPTVRQHNSPS